MQILAETGCYADMTLPSAPDENAGPGDQSDLRMRRSLNEAVPHRTGKSVAVYGNQPQLPLIFEGPLILNWTRRIKGLPVPEARRRGFGP